MSSVANVERVNAKDLDAARFRAEYELRNRPVVIVGGAAQWKPYQIWTVEHLKERLGEKVVTIHHGPSSEDRKMSFIAAADAIVAQSDGSHYLQQASLDQFPELATDIARPELIDEKAELKFTNLWFGGKGCITPLHFDISENFLAQILGEKRVTLFSPSDREGLYPNTQGQMNRSRVDPLAPDHATFPLYAKVADRRLEARLEPGDVLFIPIGWWHHVETLSTSVSLNFWWFNAAQSTAHLQARITWVDLVTDNVDGAKAFYGALFDWTFDHSADAPRMTTCKVGGAALGTIHERTPDGGLAAASHWLPCINVDVLDEAVTRATERGGRVVSETIGTETDAGRKLVTVDPAGAAFSLRQKGPHIGSAPEDIPGSLFALDLIASSPDQEAFYLETLQWTANPFPKSPKGSWSLWSSPPSARQSTPVPVAGCIKMSPTITADRTQWIPYFLVVDCDASTTKAVELGATIVKAPTDGPMKKFRFAILKDPQDTLFAVFASPE